MRAIAHSVPFSVATGSLVPSGRRILTVARRAWNVPQSEQEEISRYRLARIDRALRLLSGPIRRRVTVATSKPGRLHYLEDGRPIR